MFHPRDLAPSGSGNCGLCQNFLVARFRFGSGVRALAEGL